MSHQVLERDYHVVFTRDNALPEPNFFFLKIDHTFQGRARNLEGLRSDTSLSRSGLGRVWANSYKMYSLIPVDVPDMALICMSLTRRDKFSYKKTVRAKYNRAHYTMHYLGNQGAPVIRSVIKSAAYSCTGGAPQNHSIIVYSAVRRDRRQAALRQALGSGRLRAPLGTIIHQHGSRCTTKGIGNQSTYWLSVEREVA